MGAQITTVENVDEQKLPNGNGVNIENEKELEPQESRKEEKVITEGCCQGANGISCCQDGSLEEKPDSKETAASCFQGANGISCCNGQSLEGNQGKKGLQKLTSWLGKWEQHEVLTAAGVIGAVATVAVAYSLYKRSR